MRNHSGHRRGRLLAAAALATMALVTASACTTKPAYPPACTDTVTTINAGEPDASMFPPNTPAPPAGWWNADTRTNGDVQVTTDLGAPDGFGCTSALFTTGATDGGLDKAQLFNYEVFSTPLSDVDDISYWARKSSVSTGGDAIHLALNVYIYNTGTTENYSFLVYEPYHQSGGQAAIQLDTWQEWDATALTPGDGEWWSSKIPSGPGSQSQPVPWAQMQALYPTAEIGGYGFNLGSYNPDTIVAGDGLTFGSVTTDF